MPVDRTAPGINTLLEVFDRLLHEYSDMLRVQIRENPDDMLLVRDRSDLDQIQAAVRDLRHQLGSAAGQ